MRSELDAHRTSLHEKVGLRSTNIFLTKAHRYLRNLGVTSPKLFERHEFESATGAGRHAGRLQPLVEAVHAHVAFRHRG